MSSETADLTDREVSTLAKQISKGIADGIAETRPKKVTIGEYNRREAMRNPRPKLKHACSQNGYEMRAETLTAEEIAWLNRITHGGRYNNRQLEVVFKDELGETSVNFVYANKTIDQRMMAPFKGLATIKEIVAAQEAEDVAEADAPSTKFGKRR